ncbi:MAG TPA: CehA/McbA family metallohydrolase [Gemmataceae bacterium]|nr:CehA/McbA family metallohydrolase [Gemmataceae bacterium]
MKFDMHLHTSRHSPDSIMPAELMLQRASDIGLDGVVITEHDWLWTEDELDELSSSAPGVIVLSGVEVSTKQGHFLAYGVTDPFAVPHGIGVAELCREVHRQGGAVVAAHPYRWNQPFDDILRTIRPELDGLELMSNNMDADTRGRAAELNKRLKLAGLGNSDAHRVETLGCCFTKFSCPIRDMHDLIEAIRGRKTAARERNGFAA